MVEEKGQKAAETAGRKALFEVYSTVLVLAPPLRYGTYLTKKSARHSVGGHPICLMRMMSARRTSCARGACSSPDQPTPGPDWPRTGPQITLIRSNAGRRAGPRAGREGSSVLAGACSTSTSTVPS